MYILALPHSMRTKHSGILQTFETASATLFTVSSSWLVKIIKIFFIAIDTPKIWGVASTSHRFPQASIKLSKRLTASMATLQTSWMMSVVAITQCRTHCPDSWLLRLTDLVLWYITCDITLWWGGVEYYTPTSSMRRRAQCTPNSTRAIAMRIYMPILSWLFSTCCILWRHAFKGMQGFVQSWKYTFLANNEQRTHFRHWKDIWKEPYLCKNEDGYALGGGGGGQNETL